MTETAGGEILIFDFRQTPWVESWGPIDDRVMGGISQSRFITSGSESAVFSGSVSFEHHGGFASVRSEPGNYDLSDFYGIVLRVKGDGKTYKLSLTTEPRYDSVVYRARFATESGRWTETMIPFEEFSPTFRGNVVSEAPDLDPSSITTFGFLISDRQEGAFRLEIQWIKAYRDPESAQQS
jgi:hypothetical protein